MIAVVALSNASFTIPFHGKRHFCDICLIVSLENVRSRGHRGLTLSMVQSEAPPGILGPIKKFDIGPHYRRPQEPSATAVLDDVIFSRMRKCLDSCSN